MFYTHGRLAQWTVFCLLNPAQCRTLLTSDDLFLPQNSLAPSPNVSVRHSGQLSTPTHIGQGQKRRHCRQNTGVTAKNLPHLWGREWSPTNENRYEHNKSISCSVWWSQWHLTCCPRCGYVFVVVPTVVVSVVLVVQLKGGGVFATMVPIVVATVGTEVRSRCKQYRRLAQFNRKKKVESFKLSAVML